MRMTFGQEISNDALRRVRARWGSLGLGGAGIAPSFDSCGRNVNGTPKMFTYSGIEQAGVGIDFVGRAAKTAAHDLLAEELAGEGAQAHDVRHGLGVPAFREHADGNHVLNLLARLADLPDGVDLLAQHFGLLFLSQLARRLVSVCRPRFHSLRRRWRPSAQSVPRPLRPLPEPSSRCAACARVGKFVDVDLLAVKGVLDAGGRLRAVGDGDHDRRRLETRLSAQAFAVSRQS